MNTVVDMDTCLESIILAKVDFEEKYGDFKGWADMEDGVASFCPFETEAGTFAVVHIYGNPVGIVPTQEGKIYVDDVRGLLEDLEEEYADGYTEDD